MIKLLKNANVFSPVPRGRMDILVAGGKIAAMEPEILGYDHLAGVEVIDLEGRVTAPGLIDVHVHITGGGGELGPTSRVPELQLSQLTAHGITTALGLLGTDGLTRSQEALLSKCRALTAEGITCYCLAGAYRYPSPSMLGDISRDIAFLDPVVGVKIALSDHRDSRLTQDELIRLGCDARLGGLLGGKAGLVVAHLGAGKTGMAPIFHALENSNIPVKTYLPTHCERNEHLWQQALTYTKMGGTADFTASMDGSQGGIAAIFAGLLQKGADPRYLTISSDSGGSLPRFDGAGNCIGMDVGTPEALLLELQRLVNDHSVPLETALGFLTKNPARVLGQTGVKGELAVGADADILVFDKNLGVQTLFAKGKVMVDDGAPVVFGQFEKGNAPQ